MGRFRHRKAKWQINMVYMMWWDPCLIMRSARIQYDVGHLDAIGHRRGVLRHAPGECVYARTRGSPASAVNGPIACIVQTTPPQDEGQRNGWGSSRDVTHDGVRDDADRSMTRVAMWLDRDGHHRHRRVERGRRG